jgi:hypothetical protein
MSRTIEIIVSPDGKTTIQTRGFEGASCRDATRLLEHALGQVEEERLTSEFHHAQIPQEQKNTTG